MLLSRWCVFLALATHATCQDLFLASRRLQVEPPLDALPRGWQVEGPSPQQKMIELTFAVKQQNVDQLHDALLRVSTPSSPDYGKHFTNHQVHALITPHAKHVEAVERHLQQHGAVAERASLNADMIRTVVTVQDAERILAGKYMQVRHNATGTVLHRMLGGYSLPTEVAEAVDMVTPSRQLRMKSPAPLSSDATSFKFSQPPRTPSQILKFLQSLPHNTPRSLRLLYSISGAVGQNNRSRQAVTAFSGETMNTTSLKQYWDQYCDGLTCGKGAVKTVGDETVGEPGVEAMLDIEAITGVAGNIATEFWGFGGRSPDNIENEPFMRWLQTVSNTSDEEIPKVFSTSYGEDEDSWSLPAARRLNVEFMKAGVRGISLLFSSGDEGANLKDGIFKPRLSSSPYVTAVGATRPSDGFPKPGSETGGSLSSGGFSNYWAMPEWQKDAVAEYLNMSGLPQASYGYNTKGRASPDISAQGYSYCVVPFDSLDDGCFVAGTSASTPTTSAIIALLNDLRFQLNKRPLGFLNPLIYAHMDAFNDVTTGHNTVDGRYSSMPAWPAKKGWDAVTGAGTPNYAKLAELVAFLP